MFLIVKCVNYDCLKKCYKRFCKKSNIKHMTSHVQHVMRINYQFLVTFLQHFYVMSIESNFIDFSVSLFDHFCTSSRQHFINKFRD